MHKLSLSILSALALAVPAAAYAADLPVKAAQPRVSAPAFSWTGCYLGAGGGYGMWNQENTASDAVTGAVVARSATTGGRGWFGTGQVGCDYQFAPNWVLGAFGDYNFGSLKGDLATLTGAGVAIVGSEKMKSKWAAGGRLGYVVLPNLLGYVSGGWTEAHFNQVNFTTAAGAAVVDTMPSRNYSGWFLGTGYEYGLSWLPGLFWKTEYRFSELGSQRNLLFTVGGVTAGALNSKVYEQEVRTELVWRFSSAAWR
jgi:outer membrane immunogenic protein